MADLREPSEEDIDRWAEALIAAALVLSRRVIDEWTAALAISPEGVPGTVALAATDWAEAVADEIPTAARATLAFAADVIRDSLAESVGLTGNSEAWADDLVDQVVEDFEYAREPLIKIGERNGLNTGDFDADEAFDQVDDYLHGQAIDETYNVTNGVYCAVADQNDAEPYWYTRRDDRVRDSHGIHGQPRDLLTGLFTLKSGATCRRPKDPELPAGERARCRCVMRVRDVASTGSGRAAASLTKIAALSTRSDYTMQIETNGASGATRDDGFTGTAVLEGVLTDGGDRMIQSGVLSSRDMPGLPFFLLTEQTQWGHLGARNAGRLEELRRVPTNEFEVNSIDVDGLFDMGGDIGREAQRLYESKMMRGVSVDLEVFKAELRTENGDLVESFEDYVDAVMAGLDFYTLFTDAAIIGLTGLSTPAMDRARIEVVDPTPALVAAWGRVPREESKYYRMYVPHGEGWGHTAAPALVASARQLPRPGDFAPLPQTQPAGWFSEAPTPDQPFGVTWYKSGQVDGYAALRGQPHPRTGQYYQFGQDYSHLYGSGSSVTTTEGELRCGRVFFGFPEDHPDASPHVSAEAALAEYVRRGTLGANFRAYEDRHGLRVRGGAQYGITNADFSALKAQGVSVDCRDVPGLSQQQLIAISSTTDPAFITGAGETYAHAQARHAGAGQALVASARVAAELDRRGKVLDIRTTQSHEQMLRNEVTITSDNDMAAVDAMRLTRLESNLDKVTETLGIDAAAAAHVELDRLLHGHRKHFTVPARYAK